MIINQSYSRKTLNTCKKYLTELEGIIKTVAEKEKYIIVLEKNQGGILYSAPTVDITDKIIAAFNEAAKKKTPAAHSSCS